MGNRVMKQASELLREASRYGVQITANGDRLCLSASAPPPGDLITRLSAAKSDVLALLRQSQDSANGPLEDTPLAWQLWYRARTDWQTALGYRPYVDAQRLSYGNAVNAWHARHGSRAKRGHCAGCGKLVSNENTVLALPDGAQVHANDASDCLRAYGARWRGEAADGLRRLGIKPPTDWAR